MRRLLLCVLSAILICIAFASITDHVNANPTPQQANLCPSVTIGAQKTIVVDNTCSQNLNIRVATQTKAVDGVVPSGQTWDTGLVSDLRNQFKYWSCPELLYSVDTTTGKEATYSSTKVRCLSKP